ncbi:MAG: efflux RND transporter periplasmic adaptor subunit [Proteobacteria bacterium]|nr:efflux RND transporter periplasmic adaptor subunit [Pseudomonadota bacterium]
MNMIQNEHKTDGIIRQSSPRSTHFILHILMPIFTLACGIAITFYLLNSRPIATPTKVLQAATLVEVEHVRFTPQQTLLSAMGEIISAREVEIKARVGGEITSISDDFVPGGYFPAGQKMLAIDRSDYQLVARQLQTEVTRAKSDLAMEMGNQRIAAREFKFLGEAVSEEEKSLILRTPQLEKLRATLDYSQARLEQALLNVQRTDINAPFNGVIEARMVDVGAKINESTVLAQFVGTDIFWLRLTIPIEQLDWLEVPGKNTTTGSRVNISSQGNRASGPTRSGEIVGLIASLEKQGRMAQLLVAIDDPLSRKEENRDKPRLLLGSYVQAEVEGILIESGIRVARTNIHDGNTVWLMDDDGMLDIRKVNIAFRGRDYVIVESGLNNGERLVTSALSAPAEGIPLRLQGDAGNAQQPQSIGDSETEEDSRRGKRAS